MKKSTVSVALSIALLSMTSAGASDFAGSYVGANVGQNRTEQSLSPDKTEEYAGLVAGHNWDIGGVVLGVNGFGDFHKKAYTGRDYGIDGKLGMPSGKWMPYLKLGWAGTDPGDRAHGGLGIEYKLSRAWGVVGEWTTDKKEANSIDYENNKFTIGLNYYFNAPKAAAIIPVAAAPVVVKKEPEPAYVAAPVQAPSPPPPPPPPQPKESWKIIKEAKPVTITGANFDSDSARLKPSADAKLQPVVEFATKYPDADLDVIGHTDSTASEAYNQKLSEKRAASVKGWLVKHGVSANRVDTKGMGETQPIADNKTKEGRAKNRRVEIHYTVREEKRIRVME